MRLEHWGIGAILALVVTACGPGITVTSDWNPTVEFSRFETFVVLEEAADAGLPGFIDQRIKSAIAFTLEEKGLRSVQKQEDADMAVGWQITTDERSSFQTINTGWSGYGWGHCCGPSWGMGVSSSRTTETRYTVGALVIAMFDVESEQMVFESTGTKKLAADNPTPEESQRRIDEAVARILRDFPPEGN